jgi:hypothetical protein
MSLNLSRRHLTSSQKATIALEALPFFEAEARKRILKGRNDPSQKFDQGRAAEKTAEIVGTNRQYVSDAKAIKEASP